MMWRTCKSLGHRPDSSAMPRLLDRGLLRKTLQVVGVRVEGEKVRDVVERLRGHLFDSSGKLGVRNVLPDPANPTTSNKLVLLTTKVCDAETLQPLSPTLVAFLRAESLAFVRHAVELVRSESKGEQEVTDEVQTDDKEETEAALQGWRSTERTAEDVSFRRVDKRNVKRLRELNVKVFPVKYGPDFYEYVAFHAPRGYCKLGGHQATDNQPAWTATTMALPRLDKSLFQRTLQVVGVRVEAKKIGKVVKRLHGHLLNLPRLRNVVPDPTNPDPYRNSSSKLVLLNAKVLDAETLTPLSEELVEFLRTESLAFVQHAIELDYDYYAVDQVLSKLLPEGMDIPSSFESVGHIAHLNLRDGQLPYKHVIGQVILDKNAQIRTVVNKTDSIETQFRTFPMEVLAGDDDMDVEVHESKAVFRFNYAEVYWNSRLQQEHLRIIHRITAKDVVCDMMCGIGPFAIPLGLKGCTVLANDLNPRSFHYLETNIALNKVDKRVTAYNLDGREFVAKLLSEKKQFTQVLMNLPAIALEFLDAFPGQFDHWEGELPFIHCYCFSNAEDVEKDVKEVPHPAECCGFCELLGRIMGGELDPTTTSFHQVRDVSPKKVMMCISFQLPEAIAFSAERQASQQDEPKRRKVDVEAEA
ncbi:hypothetical protein BBJ28_00005392 [Nothophytophthora sp. Chile5]|nr:hypothetical protein BBJ28_00005392 [Nothophytophthora sp. Chile5]